jgi:hypothetical protein
LASPCVTGVRRSKQDQTCGRHAWSAPQHPTQAERYESHRLRNKSDGDGPDRKLRKWRWGWCDGRSRRWIGWGQSRLRGHVGSRALRRCPCRRRARGQKNAHAKRKSCDLESPLASHSRVHRPHATMATGAPAPQRCHPCAGAAGLGAEVTRALRAELCVGGRLRGSRDQHVVRHCLCRGARHLQRHVPAVQDGVGVL